MRYERSKELLQAEIMRFDQCQPGNKATESAKQAVANRSRRDNLEDSAEQNLALAEDLWKQEQKFCGETHAPNPNDQAIERVLARLSRQ